MLKMRFYKRFYVISSLFIVTILLISINYNFNTLKKHIFFYGQFNDYVSCHHPKLDLWNPLVYEHIKNVSNVDCKATEPDWIVVYNGSAEINDKIMKKYQNVICTLTFMDRIDDYHSKSGKQEVLDSSKRQTVQLVDDFFWVDCTASSGQNTIKWDNTMAGVHRNNKVLEKIDKINSNSNSNSNINQNDKLNVLMFGFDSTSRLQFMRKVVKTYDYLTNKLDAKVLTGYNIVGDGTPQALTPILTGKCEPELPEVRKRFKNATYVNAYPFIWYNYSDNGYVTAHTEDGQWVGTYSYRLKGFKEKPTDHYMRQFYMEVESKYNKHAAYCLRSTPRHMIMLNWVKDIFNVYPSPTPKFIFGFHSEFSHDDFNLIQAIDDDFTDWLKDFHLSGRLNSTILVVFADHGSRFSSLRQTQQGKLEERMPFFSFVLPPWFKSTFPNAYNNLVANQDKLATPYDIHATLETIITNFNYKKDASNKVYTGKLPRSLSLFEPIPPSRTCEDAGIEPHWCTCLKWQQLDVKNPKTVNAANALIQFINGLTKSFRHKCSELKLKKITRAEFLVPNKNLLTFKKSSDFDGFAADLSDSTEVTEMNYQIQLITSPNDGIYEATILHSIKQNKYIIKETDISRVNKYGDQPKCIFDEQQQLRKYCYCYDQ